VLVEVGLVGAERLRPFPQEPARDAGQGLVPLGDDVLQLRLRRGPQVGSDESVEGGASADRFAFGSDVDLLAPVDLALGPLATDPL
jgi:hypothetical protein